MANAKERSSEQHKSARDLPPLLWQQEVIVQIDLQQNLWSPATVTETLNPVQTRAYIVETEDGTQLPRNRRFICPAEEPSPLPRTPDNMDPSSNP